MSERLCVTCKHFDLSATDPGYSEMTPGSDGAFECHKMLFRDPRTRHHKKPALTFDVSFGEIVDLAHFRELIDTAKNCPGFEEVEP